jgi:CRP-like cAMP-binding protein
MGRVADELIADLPEERTQCIPSSRHPRTLAERTRPVQESNPAPAVPVAGSIDTDVTVSRLQGTAPGNITRHRMSSIIEQVAHLPVKVFETNEIVLQEGQTAGVLYILADGSVEILKQDFRINTVSEPGSFFGEVSILLGRPHMATVRALERTRLHVATDPRGFLTAHPDLTLAVAALLARRLQSVTSYLADLKRQFEDHDDHLGMVDSVLESLVHDQASEETVSPGSDREYEPNE